jgi:hypothetical protein
MAKPVDANVPYWLEFLDQQGLTQRNPDVIDQKIATPKVRQIKIACGLNRGNMVAQPPE